MSSSVHVFSVHGKQRLGLIRRAAEGVKKLNERNVAWEKNVSVPVIQNLKFSYSINKRHECFENIKAAFCSTHNAISSMTKFYRNYLILHSTASAIAVSVNLYFCIILKPTFKYMSLDMFFNLLSFTGPFLYPFITSDVKHIPSFINDFFWGNKLKILHPVKKDMKTWFHSLTDYDAKFDYGYFEFGIQIFLIMNDFSILFIFSLFS